MSFVRWNFVVFPFFLGFTPQIAYGFFGQAGFVLTLIAVVILWLYGPGTKVRIEFVNKSDSPVGILFGTLLSITFGAVVGVILGLQIGAVFHG